MALVLPKCDDFERGHPAFEEGRTLMNPRFHALVLALFAAALLAPAAEPAAKDAAEVYKELDRAAHSRRPAGLPGLLDQ